MTTSAVVVLGDALDCLGALHSESAVVLPDSTGWRYARTVVIGVNGAAATSRRGLRTLLRRQAQDCIAVCRQRPTLRHLIVVVDASPTIAEDAVLTVCDEAAETTHRWIEQDCGAYVIVTFVVVTGCDNSELLARRVVCRAGQIPASDAHGVVNWREIAEASIQDLTADHYL